MPYHLDGAECCDYTICTHLKPVSAFRAYDRTMRHKLGLLELEDDGDEALVRDLLQVRSSINKGP